MSNQLHLAAQAVELLDNPAFDACRVAAFLNQPLAWVAGVSDGFYDDTCASECLTENPCDAEVLHYALGRATGDTLRIRLAVLDS